MFKRPFGKLFGGGTFHNTAMVHDGNIVAHMRHHSQIVTDHDIGQAQITAQAAQKVKDLGLNGDIKCGCRFIKQKDLGFENKRTRNRDTLALPPRKLMGVAETKRVIEANLFKGLNHAGIGIAKAVNINRLGQDAVNGVTRMQRSERVLKHHLNKAIEILVAFGAKLVALDRNRAFPVIDKAGDGAKDGRFTRPGFAHQTK